MANEKSDTAVETAVETVKCEVVRSAEGINIEAMLEKAKVAFEAYAENDKAATAAVVSSVQKILTSDKPAHKALKNITASTLSKMALGLMGEIPTQNLCDETEVRVKAYLNGQADKFLHIQRGRNAGFWFKDRLTAEELKKLTKSDA
jgi:hypothetical protein